MGILQGAEVTQGVRSAVAENARRLASADCKNCIRRTNVHHFCEESGLLSIGLCFAVVCRMESVWKFEDLVAWQLAVQLQRVADGFCEKPLIKRDFKFRDQLADAAASGPRNIAEGFGRYYHPDFARFARIAKASEEEVLNHFRDAKQKGYITLVECEDGLHAARKALKAVNGLIRYLEATPKYGR